jgi:S-adenosylmethionine:tRNA ribosyltransferase-isomerase
MDTAPKQLQIKDFDYDLPEEKIAKYPLKKRDASKLLVYDKGQIKEDSFINLPNYLQNDSLIIFNNTKVVEARLLFKKTTGTTIEIFCLEPADNYPDITTAMLQHKKVLWKCLVGNAKKWKDEMLLKTIAHAGKEIEFSAKKISRQGENFIIEFLWNDAVLSFAEVLHLAGVIPLPPYMHRDADEEDKTRYQTMYAKHDGSVAAPTAGLHFTDNVFKSLSAKNITRDFVTLHVGAGTFKPVKTTTIEAHEMHAEFFEVNVELIQKLINNLNGNIIAVGTTSLRTIESLYWMGVKIGQRSTVNSQQQLRLEDISIQQWDAYELYDAVSSKDALQALLEWMHANNINKLIAKTQIIIAPSYTLKIAKALVTNFHQPRSTLLLLVAAVIGNDWKKVYDHALNNNFRFLSYGDSCLFFAS